MYYSVNMLKWKEINNIDINIVYKLIVSVNNNNDMGGWFEKRIKCLRWE
jgi:hypothetical protein